MSKTHFKCQAKIKPEYVKAFKQCIEEQNFSPLVKYIPDNYLFFLDFKNHNHIFSKSLKIDAKFLEYDKDGKSHVSEKWRQVPDQSSMKENLLTIATTMEETEGEVSVFVHTILNYMAYEILFSESMDCLINIPSEPYPVFKNPNISENVKLIMQKNLNKVLKIVMLIKQMPNRDISDIYDDYYI